MITNLGCNRHRIAQHARSTALQTARPRPSCCVQLPAPRALPRPMPLGALRRKRWRRACPYSRPSRITTTTSSGTPAETGYTHALLDPVDAEAFAATLNEVLTEGGFLGGSPATVLQSGTAAPVMPDQAEMAPQQPLWDHSCWLWRRNGCGSRGHPAAATRGYQP